MIQECEINEDGVCVLYTKLLDEMSKEYGIKHTKDRIDMDIEQFRNTLMILRKEEDYPLIYQTLSEIYKEKYDPEHMRTATQLCGIYACIGDYNKERENLILSINQQLRRNMMPISIENVEIVNRRSKDWVKLNYDGKFDIKVPDNVVVSSLGPKFYIYI